MTYIITFLWGRGKNSWSWRMKHVDCHVYDCFNMVAYVYSVFCSSLKINRLLENKWCLFYWQKKCCFGAIFCSLRYPLRTLQHHIHEHISSQGPLCLVFLLSLNVAASIYLIIKWMRVFYKGNQSQNEQFLKIVNFGQKMIKVGNIDGPVAQKRIWWPPSIFAFMNL